MDLDAQISRMVLPCQCNLTASCRDVLSGAKAFGANLAGSDLYRATLRGADLTDADLSRVSLRNTDLREARCLSSAMRGVDLWGGLCAES